MFSSCPIAWIDSLSLFWSGSLDGFLTFAVFQWWKNIWDKLSAKLRVCQNVRVCVWMRERDWDFNPPSPMRLITLLFKKYGCFLFFKPYSNTNFVISKNFTHFFSPWPLFHHQLHTVIQWQKKQPGRGCVLVCKLKVDLRVISIILIHMPQQHIYVLYKKAAYWVTGCLAHTQATDVIPILCNASDCCGAVPNYYSATTKGWTCEHMQWWMLLPFLQNEVTLLRNEVAQLKQLLLAHKDCPVTALQKKTQGYLGKLNMMCTGQIKLEPVGFHTSK